MLAQPSGGVKSCFCVTAVGIGRSRQGAGGEGMRMVVWGITGIAEIARCCGGLWRFLIVRAMGRTAVELERERNRATAEVIRLLPPDCELLEYELGGRCRVIRRTGSAATMPAMPSEALAGPNGEQVDEP